MRRRQVVILVSALALSLLLASCGLFASGDSLVAAGTDNAAGTETAAADSGSTNPIEAGNGFVFSVVEKYSANPVGIIEVDFVFAGEESGSRYISSATSPTRHVSGVVTQSELCADPNDAFQLELYSYITVVEPSGTSTQVTPCSAEISDPSDVARLTLGQLSPGGGRVVAQLETFGEPSTVMVFENNQLIDRFDGYHGSAWIDDNSLVLIGDGLASVELGGRPTLITSEVNGGIAAPSVSPTGDRVAFMRDGGIWVIGTDGSDLREVMPAEGYLFPAWSPDGSWVAALQREPLEQFDGLLVGSPGLVGGVYWNDTTFQSLAIVNIFNGDRWYGDISGHLTADQMPQGRLSWF